MTHFLIKGSRGLETILAVIPSNTGIITKKYTMAPSREYSIDIRSRAVIFLPFDEPMADGSICRQSWHSETLFSQKITRKRHDKDEKCQWRGIRLNE